MLNDRKSDCARTVFCRVLTVLVFCLIAGDFAVYSQTTVTVNSTSQGGVFRGALDPPLTQLNFNHTVNTGAQRALYVLIATYGQARTVVPRVTTVEYVTNQTPPQTFTLQSIGTVFSPGLVQLPPLPSGSLSTAEVYRLVAPPISSGQIRITTLATDYIFAVATTLNRVDQTNPNRAFFTDNGNYNPNTMTDAPTVVVSDAQNGDLVIDILSTVFESGSAIEGPGQQVCTDESDEATCTRGRQFFGGISDVGASSRELATGSPVTMSWTTGFGGDYALGAFAVALSRVPPTAASVAISGRVLSPTGRGVGAARLILTESDGTTRTAVSNPLGYYRFEDVAAGQTATVEVRSKRFEFAPQTFAVTEEMTNLNFTPLP